MNEMLNQTYGVEVEMYHILRNRAAQVVAASLSDCTGDDWDWRYVGGVYDAYAVSRNGDTSSRWLIERDGSISDIGDQQVELVTPLLSWQDMPALQQVIRDLRKAGARSDPAHMCGIHVHVAAAGHSARTLRNLVNIMASHETLLMGALNLDPSRVCHYAAPVDPRFLREMNLKKPTTMDQVERLWYNGAPDYRHYHPSRYHMLNLHSMFTDKGIEFRLFQFDNYDASAPRGRRGGLHAGQLKAYVQLCLALSHRAKTVRSSSPKVLETDNPRYAMRCWLLRLGFIGEEFATARSVFTRRLEGDCSFRHGRPKKAETSPVSEESVVIVPGACAINQEVYVPAPEVPEIFLVDAVRHAQQNCRHSFSDLVSALV